MALPEEFSPWEHLQSTATRIHNRRVREFFKDLGGADWDPDINTSRGSMRVACTILDNDTADMVMIRHWLFYAVAENFQRAQNPIYGIPITSFQEERKFKPQILLYFQEDLNDVDPAFDPVDGRISFRIMNETSQTLSQAEINIFANRVQTHFGTGAGFVWKKGKVGCNYVDREKGYQLQLYCRNKTEGRRVIEQVLDIQNHTPDWSKMTVKENENPSAAYPIIPPNIVIQGKTYKEPRRLPIADVRFQYATMNIWGAKIPKILMDRTGLFPQAINKSY